MLYKPGRPQYEKCILFAYVQTQEPQDNNGETVVASATKVCHFSDIYYGFVRM